MHMEGLEEIRKQEKEQYDMAHIGKFEAHSLGRLFLHNNRKKGDGTVHKNEEIDDTRTELNYHFVECTAKDVKDRLKHYYHLDRKNLVVLAEVNVTLPKEVRERDSEKFFELCYEFFCQDFGKENVLNAVVHMDETTPHLHLDFLPVKPLEPDMSDVMRDRIKKYEETHGEVYGRLCAREVLSREYYATFHQRLKVFMDKELGYDSGILNGATANGNKTLLQMKNETLKAQVETKEKQLKEFVEKMNYLSKQVEKSGFDKGYFSCPEIMVKLDMLERENNILKETITKNGIAIPAVDFQKLNELKRIFEKTHFYMTMEPLDYKGGIRVIETYREKPRVIPEWKLAESIKELEECINEEPMSPVYMETNNREKFIVFPTDDIGDTARNLVWMKQKEREFLGAGRDAKILFPQISNDIYNIAETVLRGCEFDTIYQLRRKKSEEKDRSRSR